MRKSNQRDTDVEPKTPAENIINKLGGLTKTARLLSTDEKQFPISTVQGWKDRGEIPQKHWAKLMEAGRELNVPISLSEFLAIEEGVQ